MKKIYCLDNKAEVFKTTNLLSWLNLPYELIDVNDISPKSNSVIIASPKQFSNFDECVELLKDNFTKVIIINDDNLPVKPQQIKNTFVLGYETEYDKQSLQFIENDFNFNYVHCRVAFEKSIDNLPLIVKMLNNRIRGKHYTNLNRYPKVHRLEVMDYIIKNDLFDDGYNSFVFGKRKVDNLFPKKYNSVKQKLPITLDLNKFNSDWTLPDPFTNSDGIPYQYTLDSYLQIVTETQFSEDGISWVSEKIAKPFVSMNTMLLVAQPGTLNWWKQKGFETFDYMFDESYDLEKDDKKRISLILQELTNYINLDLNDVNDIYNQNINKMEHNFYHFKNYANNELQKVLKIIND